MGSARQPYHHGDLRQALIEAALSLVARHGVDGFSLREAAREAGVAASAPYKHFDSRAALLTAVAEDALGRLLKMTQQELEQSKASPGLERYRAMGIALVKFAVLYPSHFRVMNHPQYADPKRSELIASSIEHGERLVQETLAQAHDSAQLTSSAQVIELVAGSLMFGLATRIVDGHFGDLSLEQAQQLARLATEVLGQGIARHEISSSDLGGAK